MLSKGDSVSQKNLVQSVQRALSIIELLGEKGELGVTEIGERLQLDKSTAFRLLATLKHSNFIVQNKINSKYSNSYRLFELGQTVLHKTDLITRAYPYMRDISIKTGETVNLAIREGSEVVYIEKIETDDILKVSMNLGQRKPMYCTAVGKALLSHLPSEVVYSLANKFEYVPFTPSTITNKEDLLEEVKEIKVKGYATDDAGHFPGIYCVAAPLLNTKNEAVGAIGISIPKFKLDADPNKLDFCIETLLERTKSFSNYFLGVK